MIKIVNSDSLIKIEPYFRNKIWGGSRLKDYNLNIPSNNTGEAWLISAVKDCESLVPKYKMNLRQLWELNSDNIFGNKKVRDFPLLTKILDANDILSVQVHPNDEIALKQHNCYGKAESWYFLKLPIEKKIVYGHNAKNKEEFDQFIKDKDWDKFLKKVSIKENDFVYIPPGKVHSLTKGAMVLEIQQSSDITYRIYDFDRKTKEGKYRELMLDESRNSITFPDKNINILNTKQGTLIDNNFFTIDLITTKEKMVYKILTKNWVQFTIIDGVGTINNINVKKGDSYIISHNRDSNNLMISPNLKLILSYQK